MADSLDLQQSVAWRASRRAARRYRETGNPLFAWEAAGIALGAGLPMPERVLAYVTRAARALGAPQEAPVDSPRAHVFRALEIGGRGPSAFERRRRFERDLQIRAIADALRRNMKIATGDALERVAEDAGRDAESMKRQARRRTNIA